MQGLSITLRPVLRFQVNAYCVVDWGVGTTDKRSQMGYIIYVSNIMIAWKSSKQPRITRSSTEAEF